MNLYHVVWIAPLFFFVGEITFKVIPYLGSLEFGWARQRVSGKKKKKLRTDTQ